MQELSLLEYLDKPNDQLSSVWALAPPLSSKLGPSLLDLPLLPQDGGSKNIKGSRFAKFMADRDELLKNTPQPDKPEGSQTKFISSKLWQSNSEQTKMFPYHCSDSIPCWDWNTNCIYWRMHTLPLVVLMKHRRWEEEWICVPSPRWFNL